MMINPAIVQNGKRVSLAQHSQLGKDVSEAEEREAVWEIGDDKAPGVDGYASFFFFLKKKAWNGAGKEVVAIV